MKSIILSSLFASSAYATPLVSRQSCPSDGLSASRAAEIRSAFQSSGVIPDSVPDLQPTTELSVRYGNINENLGNEFNVLQTLQEPIFSFDPEPDFDPSTTKYTYIQVDPDAPGPALPLLRQFLHHIVYDIQPSCIAAQTPKTQARYMPPTPLSVSAHRYVSLLYRQPPNYTPPQLNLIEDIVRAPFDLQAYVAEGGLELVGGNFMREGLGTTLCAIVPGCTATGEGYDGPLDGSALTGVVDIITGA
ncbi:phosphatidylethanolamine-binding-like protein [Paraphoma chrysanthemicola]|uniref:Phosphatidylethanolamine-binding-like protein n=1 Tax=Paraphoma chrysanthemicola TaxID=798071 RepID=A0A8K0VWA2_9PLEO|nr:phosphatidylethanolamine-binding-like protein [Paraphoma chrysanthemicola]